MYADQLQAMVVCYDISMYICTKLLACFYPAKTAFAQEPLDKDTACYNFQIKILYVV